MEWVETTGKSVEEAKETALDQLGVDEGDAEFEVVEEPKPGLFGRIRGEARVRARVRPTRPRPEGGAPGTAAPNARRGQGGRRGRGARRAARRGRRGQGRRCCARRREAAGGAAGQEGAEGERVAKRGQWRRRGPGPG